MCSMNKMPWIKVCIWKVSTNSLLLMTTQFKWWSSEYSASFTLLNEDRNYNMSFKYLDWCLIQMKKAFETNNKEK